MKKKFIALSMLMFASNSHCMTRSVSNREITTQKSENNPQYRTAEDIRNGEQITPAFQEFLQKNKAKTIEPLNEHSSTGTALNQVNEQDSEDQAINFDVNSPEPESQATSPQTNLQRLNQQLNSVARSAYQNIASLGTPTGRQAFVDSVSAMFTNAGQSVPSAASFRAFFSSITPNMSMPDFMSFFNRFFAKSAKAPVEPVTQAPVAELASQPPMADTAPSNPGSMQLPSLDNSSDATKIQSAWRRKQAQKKAAASREAKAKELASQLPMADTTPNEAPARQQTNLQRLNSIARSAYQNIASLRESAGRQAFVDSVSVMFTNAGQSVPSAESFKAFFNRITQNMSWPNFQSLFNKFFAKSAEAAAEASVAEKLQGSDLEATAKNQLALIPGQEVVDHSKDIAIRQANLESVQQGRELRNPDNLNTSTSSNA